MRLLSRVSSPHLYFRSALASMSTSTGPLSFTSTAAGSTRIPRPVILRCRQLPWSCARCRSVCTREEKPSVRAQHAEEPDPPRQRVGPSPARFAACSRLSKLVRIPRSCAKPACLSLAIVGTVELRHLGTWRAPVPVISVATTTRLNIAAAVHDPREFLSHADQGSPRRLYAPDVCVESMHAP